MYAGKKLRALRLQLDKSQDDMAEYIGLSRSYYAAVETGKRPISEKMIKTLVEKGVTNEGYFSSEKDTKRTLQVRGIGEGVSEGDDEKKEIDIIDRSIGDEFLNNMRTRTYEAMSKRPYKFYNSFSTKELDFELSLQIEEAKDSYNDYKLLCEALTALNPPDFLLEKFPIPDSFSEYRKGHEEDFEELHGHLTDERQIKLIKIVDYQGVTEHNRYLVSNLIMYIHQYSELIVARTVRETLDGKSVLNKVYEFRENKSFDLNIISPSNKSKDTETQQ